MLYLLHNSSAFFFGFRVIKVFRLVYIVFPAPKEEIQVVRPIGRFSPKGLKFIILAYFFEQTFLFHGYLFLGLRQIVGPQEGEIDAPGTTI
jgi:hypothetical protein